MKQEILNFNFQFKSKEFFVSEKNFFAYDFIKKWPDWNNQLAFIYGPEKCGKTSISEMWKKNSKAIYVSGKSFNRLIPDELDIDYIKMNNWILEDIDQIIKKKRTI